MAHPTLRSATRCVAPLFLLLAAVACDGETALPLDGAPGGDAGLSDAGLSDDAGLSGDAGSGDAGSGDGGACGGACGAPPANACADGSTLTVYDPRGTCVEGRCEYASSPTACEVGCAGGACEGEPCAGVPCVTPPADRCDGDTLVQHAATGTCVDGDCGYEETRTVCPAGCAAGACLEGCAPGTTVCDGDTVRLCGEDRAPTFRLLECAGACVDGACDATCSEGQTRCVAGEEQACEASGDGAPAWVATRTCETRCSARHGVCERGDVTLRADLELGGTLVSTGTVTVEAGVTVTVPGSLDLYADTIVLEDGARIDVTPSERADYGACFDRERNRRNERAGGVRAPHVAPENTQAAPGGSGCRGGFFSGGVTTCSGGSGGAGGGVVRLIATSAVRVAGAITVDGEAGGGTSCLGGGGGGGAGGTIVLWGPSVDTTGAELSASGGRGGSCSRTSCANGRSGASGLVKTFEDTDTVDLPILALQSASHPTPTVMPVYNDGALRYGLVWERPTPAAASYLLDVATSPSTAPLGADAVMTPGPAGELSGERIATLWGADDAYGDVFLNVVSVDGDGTVNPTHATVGFVLQHAAPDVTSSTHSDAWTDSPTPSFELVLDGSTTINEHVQAFRYAITQRGDSVPGAGDRRSSATRRTSCCSPADQVATVSVTGLAPGVHMIHAVSLDGAGYPTARVGRLRFRVGPDPGAGTLSGTVRDRSGAALQGATLTLNRGLMRGAIDDVASDLDGRFTFAGVPAGEWTVTASAVGFREGEGTATVDADGTASMALTLDAE